MSATHAPATFRRSRSLRLRGEAPRSRLSPRSPLGPGALFPTITESHHGATHCDGAKLANGDLPHRRRSQSLSAVGLKVNKGLKSPNECTPPPVRRGVIENPNTPPGSPEELPDDESLHSYSSAATAASVDGAYAPFNGTTFSGRSMRYVLHCSSHAGLAGDDYLTPTQRAQRQIRRLKALLTQAKKDLEKKDSEIFRLTKEVVELRLYKASLSSPDEKSNSSDVVTVRENTIEELQTPDSPNITEIAEDCPTTSRSYDDTDGGKLRSPSHPHTSDMQSSFTDSGHFEDLTNSSVHSKDSVHLHTQDVGCSTDPLDREEERLRLISLYEQKIEEISRRHFAETQDTKKSHNDKVESLLQKMAEVNVRYCELTPSYESARERIRELERQLEDLSRQLAEHEDKHKQMYVQMYNKGVEAAKFEEADQALELTHASPSRVSVPELLQQLQVTQRELDNIRDTSYTMERPSTNSRILLSAKEAVSLWVLGARKAMYRRIVEAQGGKKGSIDPEVTLQFLKSAIYYFLTDPENHQGHLNAIESILGFTEVERRNIQKARSS